MIDNQRKFSTNQKKYNPSLIEITKEWRYKTFV